MKSSRVANIKPSATLQMAKISRKLKSEGKDVISLSLGQPDFDTPEYIKKAAIEAINKGYTGYTPVNGIPELREAIVHFYKKLYNAEFSVENTIVSVGAKHSLMNLFLSMVNPGDEVILLAPYWVSYYPMVQLADGTPVIVDTSEDNFKINIEKIRSKISDKTRFIVINSPNNPSGVVYSEEEIKSVLELAKEFPNLYIISDEIYHLIEYENKFISCATFPEYKDRVIIVNGVSKAFAMTGWRIGFILANKEIVSACETVQGQITSGATSISQWASVKALTSPLNEVYKMRDEFLKRRNFILDFIKDNLPQWNVRKPEGAFYLYPDISYYFGKKTKNGKIINSSTDFVNALLYEANIAVVPGEAFGTNKHIRISYSASLETLKTAFERIKHFCNNIL